MDIRQVTRAIMMILTDLIGYHVLVKLWSPCGQVFINIESIL